MMKTLIWSATLYCAETWTLRKEDITRLEAFEMRIMASVATLKNSKTVDGPLKKTQKTPGQICKDFAEKSNFSWKKSNFFSKKSNFFPKKRLLSKKFLMTFFFSHQL